MAPPRGGASHSIAQLGPRGNIPSPNAPVDAGLEARDATLCHSLRSRLGIRRPLESEAPAPPGSFAFRVCRHTQSADSGCILRRGREDASLRQEGDPSLEVPTKAEIHIGPAGWSYPDWDGIVYPSKKERSFDPLEFIASYFDLVEVNSTFYRVPSRGTCRRWVERTAQRTGFLFTAKAPQDMTHRTIPATEREVAAFKAAIEPMMESRRLGAVLIQFPWSFRPSSEATAYVRSLCEWFSPFPTAVEVRHGAWAAPRHLRFFSDTGITLCGIDQPVIGNSFTPHTYSPANGRAYFRLHGRNREKWFSSEATRDDRYDYLYSADELSFWRDKIHHAAERAQKIFVVLNNHFRGQAVVNGLELKAMLTGEASRAPRELASSYPRSRDVLRPDSQPRAGSDSAPRDPLDLFETDDDAEEDQGNDGKDR